MPSSKTNQTAKKTPAKNKSSASKASKTASSKAVKSDSRKTFDEVANQLVPYILICFAIFVAVCFIFTGAVGIAGRGIDSLLRGLFGGAGFTLPLFILNIAIFFRSDFEKRIIRYKLIFSAVCLIFLGVLTQVFSSSDALRESLSLKELWSAGLTLNGGGAIGGFFGALLMRLTGKAGTLIISFSALLCFGLFLFGMTPYSMWVSARYALHVQAEKQRAAAEYRRTHPKPQTDARLFEPPQIPKQPDNTAQEKRKFNPATDIPATDDAPVNAEKVPIKLFGRSGNVIEVDDSFDAGKGDERVEENPAKDTGEALSDENMVDEAAYNDAAAQKPELDPDDAGELQLTTSKGGEKSILSPFLKKKPSKEQPASDQPASLGEIFSGHDEDNAPWDEKAVKTSEKEGEDADADADEGLSASAEIPLAVKNPSRPKPTREISGGSEPLIPAEILSRLSQNSQTAQKPLGGLQSMTGTLEDDKTLEIERRRMSPDTAPQSRTPLEYKLPPTTLLKLDPAPPNADISEELNTTAKKLVDTLNSFKVRTRIVNVSRGPTITRYELAPDEGVRVRSIANLVDDISLNLATTGVRIEAPIPGKSAVGIEVPNRVVATVWLREMLENPKFRASQSKVCVSLGMDVAGEPIYVDISKMPHLLIAGATGMGKSVCINSMIVSLFYKATPDEVKLILVDPKKVELNVYNGLPHLLVPVVSDPKKAAGSLQWAVAEMERRFTLIEEAGVRDLKNYNSQIDEKLKNPATALDDEGEPLKKLPQIIIIIDELADLMMTAPDDVEESICRLAQKARAAGMHLVIGTQRPSVDVITGLIKANIPSRIAFTVASQVDSRTIIDIGGAEKLIGRGDMLFAPVGSPKPVRVQGAFVSEGEVDAVTAFIKKQTGETEYDSSVMDSIEKAAAECGNKKGASSRDSTESEDDGPSDPMLKPAIELAIECGKISTSLIQRRLSLGYGRAAKLIDKMEQLGYVSAPDGQKPRNVLISKQQYMEMVLNQDSFD